MQNVVMQYVNMKWKRPYEAEDVRAVLTTLAETRPRGYVVFEIRGRPGQNVQYLIGAEKKTINKVKRAFMHHGDIQFRDLKADKNGSIRARPGPTTARMLKITKPNLSLNTDISAGMLRSGLSSLNSLPRDSSAVIQIILGAAYPPRNTISDQNDPNATWLDIVLGNVRKASSEQMKSLRQKANQYSYETIVRIGATGPQAEGILNTLTGVFRTMSSAGVRVTSKAIDPADITKAKIPWQMPLRLSVEELAVMTLLPVGEEEYKGVSDIHPMDISPPDWYRSPTKPWLIRAFATTSDPTGGKDLKLSISPKDALEHTVILGPTGAGKSTVLLNLIMADISAGRSILVIDPKADLVNDILARMPEERLKDLIVIDPSDPQAVGWNPLEVSGGGRTKGSSNGTTNSKGTKHPELVADAILAVFREIFSENWGIRAQDILSAGLLTLAEQKDATLMWLPTLLTDETFRRRITSNVKDKVALEPFWNQYEALKESERRAMIESSLNKVRQIMFRPGLRNVLGQAHPKFKLSELFTKRKVVLVPLNKGLIGADSARLLGSLLVGLTWIEVLSRANIPQNKRHIVSMYIDELQDYISLPGSFADSLAQARGLGLAITVAHQYRAQLDANLREGIDANCRNKIIFGLSGSDASSITHLTTDLAPVDFMSLPRYHIYTNFMVNGKATGWFMAQTDKPTDPIRLPYEAKAMSQEKYGKPAKEVEQEIVRALYPDAKGRAAHEKLLDPTGNQQEIEELARNEVDMEDVVIGMRPDPDETNEENNASDTTKKKVRKA